MIGVIDYKSGNLGSIINMFKRLGHNAEIVDNPNELSFFDRLVLPGVGAFDSGMRQLIDGGWVDSLNHSVLKEEKPVLGICLGMQLMTEGSEEGVLSGLGWIKGRTKRIVQIDRALRVPHMGWSDALLTKNGKIVPFDDKKRRFYFVHSYFVDLDDSRDNLFLTDYGGQFCSGFECRNIIGLQFHPEKSHKYGMEIFDNFASSSFDKV